MNGRRRWMPKRDGGYWRKSGGGLSVAKERGAAVLAADGSSRSIRARAVARQLIDLMERGLVNAYWA